MKTYAAHSNRPLFFTICSVQWLNPSAVFYDEQHLSWLQIEYKSNKSCNLFAIEYFCNSVKSKKNIWSKDISQISEFAEIFFRIQKIIKQLTLNNLYNFLEFF